MHKVFQLPRVTCRSLITPSLALFVLLTTIPWQKPDHRLDFNRTGGRGLHLNAAFLPCRRLKIAFPNPLCDFAPQRAALPLSLLFHGPNGDLFLRTRHIREHRARLGVFADHVPLSLVVAPLHTRACANGRGEVRLERVGLARKVALALVLDRRQPAGRTLDVRSLGELDVGRSVPKPFDA